MTHFKKIALVLAAASVISAAPAFAVSSYGSGGGGSYGGGGGGGGSYNAPVYNPTADYQAGLKLLRAGEYKDADRKLKKVIRGTSRNASANYYMGLAKVGQEKHKDSVRYFKSAAKYDKNLFEAHSGLGVAYAVTGKTDKANDVIANLNEAAVKCGTCSNAGRIKTAQDKITAALNSESTTDS